MRGVFRLAVWETLGHIGAHMIRTSFTAALALLTSAVSPQTAAKAKPAVVARPTAEPAVEPKVAAPAGRITFTQCNVEGPVIAMTFDDGPHATQTPRLLKMLKERNIHATFFVVGQCVAQNPEIAKQIVEEGHEMANHSWSHPQLTKLVEGSVHEQLQKTHDVIVQTTGVKPTLMRPPFGAFTTGQRTWSHAEWGYKCILWDVDSLDWQHRNPAKTESIIMSNTHSGSIVLCHDIHKTTIDAMAATLDGLIAKGFKFVTTSELLAMHKEAPPKTKAVKSLTPAEATGVATSIEEIAKPAAQ